ncbi:unnamed protein product [Amoebophrya sp. A25]|nr:unnamed protein product [Amoebophrya sp. A25]|eukprot:GSA25T00007044001.1
MDKMKWVQLFLLFELFQHELLSVLGYEIRKYGNLRGTRAIMIYNETTYWGGDHDYWMESTTDQQDEETKESMPRPGLGVSFQPGSLLQKGETGDGDATSSTTRSGSSAGSDRPYTGSDPSGGGAGAVVEGGEVSLDQAKKNIQTAIMSQNAELKDFNKICPQHGNNHNAAQAKTGQPFTPEEVANVIGLAAVRGDANVAYWLRHEKAGADDAVCDYTGELYNHEEKGGVPPMIEEKSDSWTSENPATSARLHALKAAGKNFPLYTTTGAEAGFKAQWHTGFCPTLACSMLADKSESESLNLDTAGIIVQQAAIEAMEHQMQNSYQVAAKAEWTYCQTQNPTASDKCPDWGEYREQQPEWKALNMDPMLAWAIFWSPINQQNLWRTYQTGIVLGSLGHQEHNTGKVHCEQIPNTIVVLGQDLKQAFAEPMMAQLSEMALTRLEDVEIHSAKCGPQLEKVVAQQEITPSEQSKSPNAKSQASRWALVMAVGGQTALGKNDLRIESVEASTLIMKGLLEKGYHYVTTRSVLMKKDDTGMKEDDNDMVLTAYPRTSKKEIIKLPKAPPSGDGWQNKAALGQAADLRNRIDEHEKTKSKKANQELNLSTADQALKKRLFWIAFYNRVHKTELEYHIFKNQNGFTVYVWGGPVGKTHLNDALGHSLPEGIDFAGKYPTHIKDHRSLDLYSTTTQENILEVMLAQQGLMKLFGLNSDDGIAKGVVVKNERKGNAKHLNLIGEILTVAPNQGTRGLLAQQFQQDCTSGRNTGEAELHESRTVMKDAIYIMCGDLIRLSKYLFIAPTGNPRRNKINSLFEETRSNAKTVRELVKEHIFGGESSTGENAAVLEQLEKDTTALYGTETTEVDTAVQIAIRDSLDWQMLGWYGLRVSKASSLRLKERVVDWSSQILNKYSSILKEQFFPDDEEGAVRAKMEGFMDEKRQAELKDAGNGINFGWWHAYDTVGRVQKLDSVVMREGTSNAGPSELYGPAKTDDQKTLIEFAVQLIKECPGGFTTQSDSANNIKISEEMWESEARIKDEVHNDGDHKTIVQKEVQPKGHVTLTKTQIARRALGLLGEDDKEEQVYCIKTVGEDSEKPKKTFLLIGNPELPVLQSGGDAVNRLAAAVPTPTAGANGSQGQADEEGDHPEIIQRSSAASTSSPGPPTESPSTKAAAATVSHLGNGQVNTPRPITP